jgi:hypothetical protein
VVRDFPQAREEGHVSGLDTSNGLERLIRSTEPDASQASTHRR